MLDGGRINGKLVIAKAWQQGALRHQASADAPDRGYDYLWWTDTDDS